MRIIPKSLFLAASSAICLTGCFLGNDDKGPSAEAVQKSDASTAAASANLETSMARMTDMDQYRYGEEDLTSLRNARAEFEEAVRLNPGNNKAQLGMALTGVLLAGQSERLSGIINQTLDAKSPFDSRVADQAPALRAGVLRKVAAASQFPEFHEIQDAIADTLLPALDEAVQRLTSVYNDRSFSMTMTLEGEVRELDHAEAGILLAGVRAMHGLLTLWLAYDIDIDDQGSYDYLEALAHIDTIGDFSELSEEQKASLDKLAGLLGPESPFMAVRPAWKTRLAGVDDGIKAALDALKEALASIEGETDPQQDDLLRLCEPGENGFCLEGSAYQAGLDGIDTARKYLAQPYAVQVPGLDTTIMVDFAAYFNVQDFKKMLPHYGFYKAADWSEDKPVLYFTDKGGRITGNIKTITDIVDEAADQGITAAEAVDRFRTVLHLQDPTFQGFLPGATDADIWNLYRKLAEQADTEAEEDDFLYKKSANARAPSILDPGFALKLIGG